MIVVGEAEENNNDGFVAISWQNNNDTSEVVAAVGDAFDTILRKFRVLLLEDADDESRPNMFTFEKSQSTLFFLSSSAGIQKIKMNATF